MTDKRSGLLPLVLFPVAITFVLTAVRLLGEHFGWNADLFPRAPDDRTPIGISWLIFVFGLWFGVRLQRAGAGPKQHGRAVLLAAGGLVVAFGGMALARALDLTWFPSADQPGEPRGMGVMLGVMIAGTAISFLAWPRAASTLLVYGILARLSVVLAIWLSLHYGLDTHYAKFNDGFPVPAEDQRFVVLCMPHVVFWPMLGVLLGTVMASLAAFVTRGKSKK